MEEAILVGFLGRLLDEWHNSLNSMVYNTPVFMSSTEQPICNVYTYRYELLH
jgi:hypothetical protein